MMIFVEKFLIVNAAKYELKSLSLPNGEKKK
jgi:hypothetical protein